MYDSKKFREEKRRDQTREEIRKAVVDLNEDIAIIEEYLNVDCNGNVNELWEYEPFLRINVRAHVERAILETYLKCYERYEGYNKVVIMHAPALDLIYDGYRKIQDIRFVD